MKLKRVFKLLTQSFDIVTKRLHLYNDMKLVKFGINEERNLIGEFLYFIQPYIQQQLIFYQIQMVPVSIIDLNK